MRTNSPFIPEDAIQCIISLSIRNQLRGLRACLVLLSHYLAISLSDSRPAQQALRAGYAKIPQKKEVSRAMRNRVSRKLSRFKPIGKRHYSIKHLSMQLRPTSEPTSNLSPRPRTPSRRFIVLYHLSRPFAKITDP